MTAKLYALPGSHPCAAVEAALKLRDRLPPCRPAAERRDARRSAALRWQNCARHAHRRRADRRVASDHAPSRRARRRARAAAPAERSGARAGCWRPSGGGDEVLQSVPAGSSTSPSCAVPRLWRATWGDAKLPLPARCYVSRRRSRPARWRSRTRRATSPPGPTSLPFRASSTGSTPGSPTACSAAISPTPRTADRLNDPSATDDRRHPPLIDARPATRLTRYFPPMAGEIPAGVLPAEWTALRRKTERRPAVH